MNKRKIVARWIVITVIWLIITALFGSFLRAFSFMPAGEISYPNLLHGHSHVAFLGWIFNALFILMVNAFLLNPATLKYYDRLFWLIQLTVAGMFIFFPFYGYNPLTIAISTAHTVLSVIFAIAFFKSIKSGTARNKWPLSILTLSLALVFMLISAAGPLMLAPIAIGGLKGSIWYNLAIYFYLHFQYNGWFFFGLAGLTFYLLESNGIQVSHKHGVRFVWANFFAIFPAYALSALWTSPPEWVVALALLGTGIQLISLFFLVKILQSARGKFRNIFPNPQVRMLFVLVLASVVVRNVLQFAGSMPGLSELSGQHRYVIIGFLHLNFLGMITPFLMGIFMHFQWVRPGRKTTAGIFFYIAGFVLSELVLFLSPVYILPFTPQLLLGLALITTLGLLAWSAAVKFT